MAIFLHGMAIFSSHYFVQLMKSIFYEMKMVLGSK